MSKEAKLICIRNRISLLEHRTRDNEKIIRKLKRKERTLMSN